MRTAGASSGRGSRQVGLVALLLALATAAACAGEKKQKKQTSSSASRPTTRSATSAVAEVVPPSSLEVLPKAADYVAIRRRAGSESASRIIAEWSKPCTRAKDVALCRERLADAGFRGPLKFDYGYIGGRKELVLYDVVFTEGDNVGTVRDAQALLALFGPVDTACEAELLIYAGGDELYEHEDFECTGKVRKEGGSYVLTRSVSDDCGKENKRLETAIDASGTVKRTSTLVQGSPCFVTGRRPYALRTSGGAMRGVGAFFARAAHLEAASVPAFRHLARELAVHGAPPELVRAAFASADDEVRHARAMAGFARRYGAAFVRPVVGAMPVRRLVDVAVDNAREGCVRETFGAVVAGVQARRAETPAVRRAFTHIALDEARHAALAWAIDAWVMPRLSSRDRRRVHETRRMAADQLAREISPLPAAVARRAGVPTAAIQREVLAQLRGVLPIA